MDWSCPHAGCVFVENEFIYKIYLLYGYVNNKIKSCFDWIEWSTVTENNPVNFNHFEPCFANTMKRANPSRKDHKGPSFHIRLKSILKWFVRSHWIWSNTRRTSHRIYFNLVIIFRAYYQQFYLLLSVNFFKSPCTSAHSWLRKWIRKVHSLA